MSTTEATVAFEYLPITKLHESPLNPRKTIDPARLAELTASVAAKGVMTPLLVRPNADGYEIGAGHRRFGAAKAAGVATVPAVVRAMADGEFLELLVFENDEREELHPLEEGAGYRELMPRAGYAVAKIAEHKGCSEKYVYDRVKLLQRVPAAQQLFRDGTITAGHAILLARLKPKDQERAIDQDAGGLLVHEHLLFNPDEEDDGDDPVKAVSVRELQAWIDERDHAG
jgi:ParB family chromosome partitioning protein